MPQMVRTLSRGFSLVAAAFVAAACGEPTTRPEVEADPTALPFEAQASLLDFSDPDFFAPIPTSASCRAGGAVDQVQLPAGFVATLLASEPSFPDQIDMNTVNETGPHRGRFLYRTHEVGSNAAVSETDLETGVSRIVAQRADWERFDGISWTPWGTIIASEEVIVAGTGRQDPGQPGALGGFVYEIDPASGATTTLAAVGSRSHEGLRFDKRGNLYGISESAPSSSPPGGYIYKFVPEHHGDLTLGRLYALRIVEDLGDRTGWAEWVEVNGDQAKLDSDAAATAVGATGWGRPEDLETDVSTGSDGRGGRMLYAAITSENRVLAIDLQAGRGARQGQVLVSDYVRNGVNAPSDFRAPDNLALDRKGNLFITEDPGGSAPGKTLGDDVWVSRFDPANPSQGKAAQRFLTITDCNAEPTGIYFSISGRTLFVNVMHRGDDGRDGVFGVQKLSQVDFQVAGR